MQETWIWSLGWEDSLEKGMATHSSILAWRIPWTEVPGKLQSMVSQRVGYDWVTNKQNIPYCKMRIHLTHQDLQKEMTTHSSVLAWRIPGTGEPGGLLSLESHRVRHNWRTNKHTQSIGAGLQVDKDSPVLYQNGSILPRNLEVRFTKQLKYHKLDEYHLVMSSKLDATSTTFLSSNLAIFIPLKLRDYFKSLI